MNDKLITGMLDKRRRASQDREETPKMGEWRKAVQYRNGAEMLRTIAGVTPDEEHLKALLAAAQHFDEEAASLEREAKAPSHS